MIQNGFGGDLQGQQGSGCRCDYSSHFLFLLFIIFPFPPPTYFLLISSPFSFSFLLFIFFTSSSSSFSSSFPPASSPSYFFLILDIILLLLFIIISRRPSRLQKQCHTIGVCLPLQVHLEQGLCPWSRCQDNPPHVLPHFCLLHPIFSLISSSSFISS